MIAYTKPAYLSRMFQFVKGLCYFFGLHKWIRTMKQQYVNVVGFTAFQAAFH